jgi:ribosomal protein S12 methylthiotransferase accessory factor
VPAGAGSQETHRVAFVGPSIPADRARAVMPDGDLRAPIKRGDLDGIPAGTIVGIVDGLFAQTLAISRGEITEAIERGVDVYGAASMGALRAAELTSVVGVGRIYEMYRTGVIERDDEVAVLVDPDTFEALTEPLVNVRYAVERLVRSGTLSRADGASIVEACAGLHYTDRTYPQILAHSRLARNRDLEDVIRLLKRFNLKRDDAQLLLETIAAARPQAASPARNPTGRPARPHARVRDREAADASVLIWESGDVVTLGELVLFLKLTGRFETHARSALARMARHRNDAPSEQVGEEPAPSLSAQTLLDSTRAQWGWESPEEAHVTMLDLGLGLDDVADMLDAEGSVRAAVRAMAVRPSEEFSKALRADLWFSDMALKREVLRLGAMRSFAALGLRDGPPDDREREDAKRTLARLNGAFRWATVVAALTALGVTDREQDAAIDEIALARRALRPVTAAMRPRSVPPGPPAPNRWAEIPLDVPASPKASGSARFSLSEDEAETVAGQVAKQMGVVRIGLVGELDTLGIYIAQAFGERSGWSSSFSSGKSETRAGARVGSIMEEVEIHAQDAYRPAERLRARFADAEPTLPLIDPMDLGLPFDSRYRADLEIEWSPCVDLLGGSRAYVPTASLVAERQTDDVFYCPRLGGKIFSSSGLGSGFTKAEAILHAGAEYIERHAYRLAETEIENPGGVGPRRFWFIDRESLPAIPKRIVEGYIRAGLTVRILDITSEIAVPTFYVRVFEDLFGGSQSMSADGFACHPDPGVAVTMALLEAAQTRGGYIAGGREDYSLQMRSLGRHERPRTKIPRSQTFWFSNDRPIRSISETVGFRSADIREELSWVVERVADAGLRHFLVADYTLDRIRPAYAVRVLIPGLETTNPLFLGPRARATLISDLAPAG